MRTNFFANKTGFEMFDTLRAYGLAFVLWKSGEDLDVEIQDLNSHYFIAASGETPTKVNREVFVDNEGWRRVFLTARERKDAKKLHPKAIAEKVLSSEFGKFLNLHADSSFSPTIGCDPDGGMPLYQTMDVSGAKGFREEKRGVTYHEGTQLYVDKYSWVASCIGGAFFLTPLAGRDFLLSLVPDPTSVLLIQHRDLQEELRKEQVCKASRNVALVHYSVKLAKTLSRRKIAPKVRYESIVFNAMQKTGQQPKPGGGGKYGMAFLESIWKSPNGMEALEMFDQTLRGGSLKGVRQELAFAVAEFLLHPTLRNFVRYEDLHVRARVNENIAGWSRGAMEVVLKNVGAS